MSAVPKMISAVISNRYTVQSGDDVGKIALEKAGDAQRYPELVGANLHKPLIDVDSLDYQVFEELQDGEKLNLPASWMVQQSAGDMGITFPQQSMYVEEVADQLTNLASILAAIIPLGFTPPISLPVPKVSVEDISRVLAQWWPYLTKSPNSLPLPPIVGLAEWLAQQPQNWTILAPLIGSAARYWEAIKALPYMPWDRVPWAEWIARFPALVQAFGNNPEALRDLLKFATEIALIPIKTPLEQDIPWVSRQKIASLPVKSYAPPVFAVTDWSQPAYTHLLDWINSNNIDPTKVPWDLITDTDTAGCFAKHPGRLAEMQADPCWKTPSLCDPLDSFKKQACAEKYVSGWCNLPPCMHPTPTCHPKTCTQVGFSCGKADDGCGGTIDCGSCPEGQECTADGKCVEKKTSSGWKWALGIAAVLAAAAGGYVVLSKGGTLGKKNPLQSRITNWHREQFPEGIEIIESMARTAFVDHWANEQEEKGRSFSQQDIFDVAPKTTPSSAKEWAIGAAVKLGCENSVHWTDDPYWTMQQLYNQAVQAGGEANPEKFGHYVAMQLEGHGVGWTDDNPDFGMKVPLFQYNG